jgi:hypothetical protein
VTAGGGCGKGAKGVAEGGSQGGKHGKQAEGRELKRRELKEWELKGRELKGRELKEAVQAAALASWSGAGAVLGGCTAHEPRLAVEAGGM